MPKTSTPSNVADNAKQEPEKSSGQGAGQGSEPQFEAITSQEQLNSLLADRLRRERAKFADYDELKAKAGEFDKLADAQKSEAQKAAEALQAAQKQAESASRTAMQYEVAAEAGLALKLASRLNGATREEMLADAAEIKGLLAEQVGAPSTPPPPRPDPSVGHSGEPTPANLAEAIQDAMQAN